MTEVKTIDDVLSQLETIINAAEQSETRLGYFAALYHRVTSRVKDGISRGIFNNGERMANLDVMFANRYLDAMESWKNGQPLTRSWRLAFDTTKKRSPLILQQLLLAIRAHINLDLGIAAVEIMKTKQLADIHADFNTINNIIGSLTYEVINEIDRMSPLLSLLGLHANKTDSFLIQFSIGNARDGAWAFAEELSQKEGTAYQQCVDQRDADIETLGTSLVNNSGLLKFTLGIIHLFEWKDPSKITKELFGYSRKFLSAGTVGQ